MTSMPWTCLLGRHWPIAAFAAAHPGPAASRCVDCGAAMTKGIDGRWQVRRSGVAILWRRWLRRLVLPRSPRRSERLSGKLAGTR